MARKVPPEVAKLLQELRDERPRRGSAAARAVGAVLGGLVGAGIGFLILLVIFGWALGGGGQGGLAALIIGVPLGAWVGAELGADEAGR